MHEFSDQSALYATPTAKLAVFLFIIILPTAFPSAGCSELLLVSTIISVFANSLPATSV